MNSSFDIFFSVIDLILRVWYDDIIKYFMALIDHINILSYIFLYVLFDDVFAYWITVEDVQECLISRLRLIISSLNISIIYTPRNKKEFTYYYWLLVHHYYYYLLLGLLFRCHWHLNNNMIFINHWRIRDWRPDEYLNSSGLQDRSS